MEERDARTDEELRGRRERLVGDLAGLQDFTPGSFQEERLACGKPGCHCAQGGDQRHGPYRSVHRYRSGKTVKKAVPAHLADEFRARCARWDAFQATVGEIADINAELSARDLERRSRPGPAARVAAGEKGGSRGRTSSG
ncbi:MAG: hypothetical protein LBK59_03470 [Bifidobacteriaceae bacterium]|jgi:hypothetical protein|nr:hypothetical protein [Bifidobacteriaceae bacterium]